MPYRHKTDYGYENFDRKTVNSDGTTFWGMDQPDGTTMWYNDRGDLETVTRTQGPSHFWDFVDDL